MSGRVRTLVLLAIMMAAACAPRTGNRTRDARLDPTMERLARNPDDVEARLSLAAALREAGDLEGALVEAYKAVASDNQSARAHAELARIYFTRNMPEEEIAAWRSAIAIDPAFVDAGENLGHALLAAGKKDDAMAEYRRVLSIRPDVLPVLYNLALLETDAGNRLEAQRLWEQYVALDPSGPWAERARAALGVLTSGAPR